MFFLFKYYKYFILFAIAYFVELKFGYNMFYVFLIMVGLLIFRKIFFVKNE